MTRGTFTGGKGTMEIVDAGKCPGCGLSIATSLAPEPAIVHGVPTCKDFDSRDAIEYLQWVRARRDAS